MQRITSLFSKLQKPQLELDVNVHADRQILKHQVIDSKTGKVNYGKLGQLLQYYPGLKTLYIKNDWQGKQYVSFKPPRLAEDQDKAREKVGNFINRDLMHHHTNMGPKQHIAVQKLLGNQSANGGGHLTTEDFRDAVQTMAGVKARGPVQQVAPKEASELDQPIEESHAIDSEPSQFKFDDPGQVTSKALDDFQHQLRQGAITRPDDKPVTSYVNELNAIHEGNSARDPSPSAVTRLVRFITTGQTESLNQPMNQLGDRVFASRYEAARFLYTETDFLENLNVDDSEYHKTVFVQVAQLEASTRRVQAAVELEESSRSGSPSAT